jgi:hypothetical protein
VPSRHAEVLGKSAASASESSILSEAPYESCPNARLSYTMSGAVMPEVHVPHAGDHHRGKSVLTIALEVVMLSVGVFLGLTGEQWREHRQHREAAEASLRRFRTEIGSNRQSVAAVQEYHVTMRDRIDKYLAAAGKERDAIHVNMQGIRPAFIEHTAWDLALATQSLAYIDEKLAFALSRVYSTQQEYEELSRGLLQAMYVNPPGQNLALFFGAVSVYYGDIVQLDPKLIAMYDDLEGQINRALGDGAKTGH